MEKLLEKKKLDISNLVEKCMGCGDGVLTVVKTEDGEKNLLCNDCGCKHYVENNRVSYEYVYKDLVMDGEVKWNISKN